MNEVWKRQRKIFRYLRSPIVNTLHYNSCIWEKKEKIKLFQENIRIDADVSVSFQSFDKFVSVDDCCCSWLSFPFSISISCFFLILLVSFIFAMSFSLNFMTLNMYTIFKPDRYVIVNMKMENGGRKKISHHLNFKQCIISWRLYASNK